MPIPTDLGPVVSGTLSQSKIDIQRAPWATCRNFLQTSRSYSRTILVKRKNPWRFKTSTDRRELLGRIGTHSFKKTLLVLVSAPSSAPPVASSEPAAETSVTSAPRELSMPPKSDQGAKSRQYRTHNLGFDTQSLENECCTAPSDIQPARKMFHKS